MRAWLTATALVSLIALAVLFVPEVRLILYGLAVVFLVWFSVFMLPQMVVLSYLAFKRMKHMEKSLHEKYTKCVENGLKTRECSRVKREFTSMIRRKVKKRKTPKPEDVVKGIGNFFQKNMN